MSDTYHTSELHVEQAIEAFHNEEFASTAAAAKAHGVEPHRLQRHLKGQVSRSTCQFTCMALNPAQE